MISEMPKCPRTGLPTGICECYVIRPDFNEPLTEEEVRLVARRVDEYERRFHELFGEDAEL